MIFVINSLLILLLVYTKCNVSRNNKAVINHTVVSVLLRKFLV